MLLLLRYRVSCLALVLLDVADIYLTRKRRSSTTPRDNNNNNNNNGTENQERTHPRDPTTQTRSRSKRSRSKSSSRSSRRRNDQHIDADNDQDDGTDKAHVDRNHSSSVTFPIKMAVGVLLLALHPHHVIVIVAMLLRRFLSPWICRYWMEWLDQRQQQQQQQQRHSSRSSTNTSTLSSSSPRFRQWIVQSLVEGGPLGRGCRKLVNVVLGLIVLGLAGHFVVSKRRVGEQEEPQWPLATNNKFATILWSHIHLGDLGGSSNHDDDHDSTNMRPAVPLWQIVLGLCLLSGAVNVVLWLWSKYCIPTTPQTSSTTGTPRGNKTTTTTTIRAAAHHHHKGVDELVRSTVGRSLSLSEHFGLGLWALINAVCEELESRGLNRAEFTALAHFCEDDDGDDRSIFWATTTTPSSSSSAAALSFQPQLLLRLAAKIGLQNHNPITASSNFWQATVFGLSHYYGIPSGWTGVALTFVYGWILGLLATVLGSSSRSSSSSTPGSSSPCALWAPIATHALADYFIFAYIARQQQQGQQQQGQQQRNHG